MNLIQIHIVLFDSNRKIQTIRLYWDQGSLLKLVDVIGARARNWPIRDGKDQARLIASSATSFSQSNVSVRPAANNGSHNQSEVSVANRPTSSSENVTGDPYASLSLFTPQDTNQEPVHHPAVVLPRTSAKPPPRNYHDLFAGNESDDARTAKAKNTSPEKSQTAKPPPRDYHDLFVGNECDASPLGKNGRSSPRKENKTATSSHIAPKGGAGKNFQPSRLFETDDSQQGVPVTSTHSTDNFYKPHPQKYDHFDFGDSNENAGAEQTLPSRPKPKTKHLSQWDFEDFMTPEKVPRKIRDQDVRHFGWSDDEPNLDSPMKLPKVVQPRPDAKTHFEFQDDGTPAGDRRPAGHQRGQGVNNGMGLYRNNVIEDSDRSSSPGKRNQPLSTATNVKNRRQDFDSHFSMADSSPANHASNSKHKETAEPRIKPVKVLDAQWEATDQSPSQPQQIHNSRNMAVAEKENFSNAGIKTSGDGMGGKKGASRTWGFGSESDEDGEGGKNSGKFLAGKKQLAPKDDTFWEF